MPRALLPLIISHTRMRNYGGRKKQMSSAQNEAASNANIHVNADASHGNWSRNAVTVVLPP